MESGIEWGRVLQGAIVGGLAALVVNACLYWRALLEILSDRKSSKDTPSRRGKVIDAAHLSLGESYDARQVTAVAMMNAGAWTYEMLPDGHQLKAAGLAAKAAICRSDDDAMTFDASLISSLSIAIGEDLGVMLEDGKSREDARQCARDFWPDLTDIGFETAIKTDRINRASWRCH